MAKKVPRTTYSAQMLTDAYMCRCVNAKIRECADAPTHSHIYSSTHSRIRGFTLIETIVAVVIILLFALLAQMSLLGVLRRSTFKAQAQELVSTMQMAASAAAESDRRYEVIIDLTEQSYLLRQITSPDLSEVLEEEIIVENGFGDNCWISYVEFDDGDYTNEGRAKFRAGHVGWQYGGKIVLHDRGEQPYSIVINRLNRIVTLKEGDVEILGPRAKEDVPF